jgi:hypothetical protein
MTQALRALLLFVLLVAAALAPASAAAAEEAAEGAWDAAPRVGRDLAQAAPPPMPYGRRLADAGAPAGGLRERVARLFGGL